MSRPVSQFSAANIGMNPPSNGQASVKNQFREEAHDVSKYLEGVHHIQKQSHSQVNYSETISKLSRTGQEPVVYTRREPTAQTFSSSHSLVVSKQNEITDRMNHNAYAEHDLNSRKRAYNREVGRIAILNSVSFYF